MAIFAAGIVWDPREPLPPELEHLHRKPHNPSYHTHIQTEQTPFPIIPFSGASLKEFPDNVVKEPTRNVLPPLSISIDGHIVGDTAKVTVSQVFWNNADVTIPRASYVFPLPNGCTVTSFSCRVGRNKVLRAKVKPKKEAQEAFQKAVAMRNTAALLEQNTPEIFTASLGNIPANTRLEAKLTYVSLLKRQFSQEKNITTFSIPTAIAGRYGNAPVDIAGGLAGKNPHAFTLQLEVMEAEKIVEVKSETHKIHLENGTEKGKASNWKELFGQNDRSRTDVAVVKLDSDQGYLQEDFILTIESSSASKTDKPHAWIESHPSLENQKAVMITIPSSFMEDKGASQTGEIIFLVDRSGSMADKIDAVKSSLRFFLKGIPVGRKFNIWSFGSNYEKLWPISQVYGSESLQLALDHVEEQFKADMGGTELLPALEAILRNRDISCPCDVVVLTDGEVWRLDETLSLVQNTRSISQGEVRFFSLGIGAHVSHALVQGIASRGGGYSEVIPKASLGGWEDRLVSMLKAALTSHIDTFKIKVNDSEDYDQYITSPDKLRYLNPFQGNRIYLLSKPNTPVDQLKSITIEIIKPNGDQELTDITMTTLLNPDTTIHGLAARAILDDMEHSANETILPYQKRSLKQAQAEELACRFSLVSSWTSFFLQEEKCELGDDDQLISSIPVQDATDSLVLLQRRGASRRPIKDSYGIAGFCGFDSYTSVPGPIYDPLVEDAFDPTIEDRTPRHDYDMSYRSPITPEMTVRDRCMVYPSEQMTDQIYNRYSTAEELNSNRKLAMSYKHAKKPSSPVSRKLGEAALGKIRSLITMLRPSGSRKTPPASLTDKSCLSGDMTKQNSNQQQAKSTSKADGETLGRHKKFVADLLTYQNFDGSIKVDASRILGPSLAAVAQEIETHIIKNSIVSDTSSATLAYTIVAVVILERDLSDCKDLWHLMRMKAVNYIAAQIGKESKKDEMIKFTEERLAGKELPLSDAATDSTAQVTEVTVDLNPQPERVVVQVAPID
ncbi:VIT-domain-containing protein [Hypoxylon sp. NC0597]|nr:VIT-domain-containing protein [Hypoxylon sp. NC0597]